MIVLVWSLLKLDSLIFFVYVHFYEYKFYQKVV